MVDFKKTVADEVLLRDALEAADIVPLAIALVHLTGQPEILDTLQPHVHGPWDYSESIPAELKREVRERLAAALKEYAAADRPEPPAPPPEVLRKMMRLAAGQPIPDEYAPMMLEQMALDGPAHGVSGWQKKPAATAPNQFKVAIIGSGMSGLCAAIKLKEAGIPFVIFEKNDTVGGTWHENPYPGCGVDTPNHFYSYSFEPNHDWSHYFSKREELWAYFERCADKYGIRPSIRFNTEVTAAHYDASRECWRITTRSKEGREEAIQAHAVISAVGQLNRPSIPKIPGLESFCGPVFHTAQWDTGQDIKGRRVAMIGTGASGMQVAPTIAADVERLLIFQRSPHWVVPNPNYHRSVSDAKRWVLKNIPFYAQWYRFQLFWGFADGLYPALQIDPDWPMSDVSLNAINERYRQNMIRHIKREIGDDPELLQKVIPTYPPYGKRILIDNHWYRTLKRDNVNLITADIDHVEAGAIVTRDGQSHAADLVVLATGFQAGRMLWPMDIRGRDGHSLRDLWGDDDPRAYMGITVPGFPNFFILYGPNTNLGHGGSAIFHAECQVKYTIQCLRALFENGWASLECRQDVHDSYNQRVDEAHRRMVWSHPGMNTWYRNKNGRIITNSPWRLVDYWKMTGHLNLDDYLVRQHDRASRTAAGTFDR